MTVNLAEYFRGDRSWSEFYEHLARLPEHGWYKSALAMDEETGRQRAQQPLSNKWEPPTPLGYSLPVLLQLKQIDLQKETIRMLPAVFGGKLPAPIPPEPRPMTAEMRIRDAIETLNVYEALEKLGIDM